GADSRQITQIQRAIKREEQKLAAVKANPELSNEAWIKIGESYMQLRDYNKARVVFRHATQFAEPDQKKRLEVQVIISHAAQGNADQADQLFAEFRKQHAKDPLAQNVKYMLGSALMQQERWDEAINAFEESLRDFPESPFSVQIPKDIARIKVQQGKPEEAIQTFRDFIKDGESGKIKVAPAVIEDTQRLLAVTLFQQKNYDEAIQILEDLSSNATTPSIKEESHLQLATILGQTGKNENAVSTYKSFSDTYPNSPSAPKALFQAGALEEKLGKSEEARATFQSLTEKFPENDVAKFAYDKIWKSYKGDLEKVIPAQDALIQAFPDSDQALAALFDRGKMLDKAKEYDSALVAFMDVVERQKNTEAPTEAKSQLAAYSLVTAAPIKQKQATSLGEYKSLDAAGQKQWSELIQSSADLYLQAVTGYPGSKAAAVALNKWVDVMLNLVAVGITKQDAVLNQMSQLAGQMPTEQSKLQIMIAQAGLQNRLGNSDISLKLYDDAFKGVTNMKIIPWQDLSNYGKLLLEAQKWQKALEIFEQLDANTKEENKHAKADANYGRGAALQGLGKLAEAQQFFDLIPKWSPRFMDAKYGSALAQFEAGKLQDAIDTVKEVISSSVSSNESKAKSMILIARSLEGMGDTGQTTPETKQQDGTDKEPYDLACNYLLKVDVLFADATPLLSSEALYHAVRIRKKEKKNQEAQKILDRLLTEYGTTKWGQKARKDY
ncbi:MAG: tetratricopeptide repeat protein, partial [Verrucomicrobiota bacterium]